YRSIGEALGISDDAAQKRVTRAVAKLHAQLVSRGVTLSVAAIAAALTSQALTAAPAGLAASVAGTALAGAATGTGSTLALLKYMATTKLKAGMITAIIVASVMTPLFLQHQAQARRREQDEVWQRQTNQLAQVTAANQRLANLLAQAKNTRSLSDNQFSEVLRLRSEIG